VRGHDISGKRIYKQLNPVESIRAAVKPLIFVFSVENERHPSVYPAHEVIRLRRYDREGCNYASIPLCPRIPSARQGRRILLRSSLPLV
jgi:hypothetical protein